MAMMQRRKGKTAEQELARLLRDELGDIVSRNLEQTRDGGSDLIGLPVCLEVKRAARPQIAAWWLQACEQAQGTTNPPALAYRLDRHPWRFILPLGMLHAGFPPENTAMTVTLGLAEFCAVIREML